MDKRGQFFILTAVIISVLIFGIGTTFNRVNTYADFSKTEKYSDMIDNELSQVQNYIAYGGENTDLRETINDIVVTLKDQDPSLNFIIIYENEEETEGENTFTIENYGSNKITAKTCENNLNKDKCSKKDVSGLISGMLNIDFGSFNPKTFLPGFTNIYPDGNNNIEINTDDNVYVVAAPVDDTILVIIEKVEGDEQNSEIK